MVAAPRLRIRREERALIRWYREIVSNAMDRLSAANYDDVVRLAQLPDRIRGYEDIKLTSIAHRPAPRRRA